MKNKMIFKIIPTLLILSFHAIETKAEEELTPKQIKQKQHDEARQKFRGPHPQILVKNMNEQQLIETLEWAKSRQNNILIKKIYNHLLMDNSNQESQKNYKLEKADYFFENGKYQESRMAYEDFIENFPSCKESEYAQYKAVLASFLTCLKPERDQTNTEKTIIIAKQFLSSAKNKILIEEIQTILDKCRKKLFEYEAHVFEYYLKQKKFISAQSRLDYIKENFEDIKQITEYLKYMNEILELAQDESRCPYVINFDLADAINKKSISNANRFRSALYFLS